MRTLALGIALSVCLGTSAAQAVCTTGVECIRERFGADRTVRNNQIIDRTDRLGDRGRAQNPYLAGQNVAGQARRAGRFDSTLGGTGGGTGRTGAAVYAADPLRGGETRPDVRYTPGTAIDPYTPGSLAPGETETGAAPDLTVAPYDPAQPVTDAAGATSPAAQGVVRGRTTRSAAPALRDQNRPQGAASRRYSGPRTTGAYR